jgi:hypothetical protein
MHCRKPMLSERMHPATMIAVVGLTVDPARAGLVNAAMCASSISPAEHAIRAIWATPRLAVRRRASPALKRHFRVRHIRDWNAAAIDAPIGGVLWLGFYDRIREGVSPCCSLLTGKKTGNSVDSAVFCENPSRKHLQIQPLA